MSPRAEARRGGRGPGSTLRCALLVVLGLLGPSVQAQAADTRAAQADIELVATPGKDTLLEFAVPCHTTPAGGACEGGTVVAQFTSRATQFVTGAWNSQGVACVHDLSYVACPMDSTRDGAIQRLHAMLHVDPREYSSNAGWIEGRDGLQLQRSSFLVRMQGAGTLDLDIPEEVVVPADSRVEPTRLGLRNRGPSVVHGLNIRIGPFPDYLVPYVEDDASHCLIHAAMLDCRPPDLAPGIVQPITLFILADPSLLPPGPVQAQIEVHAASDQAQSNAHFRVSVPTDPQPP